MVILSFFHFVILRLNYCHSWIGWVWGNFWEISLGVVVGFFYEVAPEHNNPQQSFFSLSYWWEFFLPFLLSIDCIYHVLRPVITALASSFGSFAWFVLCCMSTPLPCFFYFAFCSLGVFQGFFYVHTCILSWVGQQCGF